MSESNLFQILFRKVFILFYKTAGSRAPVEEQAESPRMLMRPSVINEKVSLGAVLKRSKPTLSRLQSADRTNSIESGRVSSNSPRRPDQLPAQAVGASADGERPTPLTRSPLGRFQKGHVLLKKCKFLESTIFSTTFRVTRSIVLHSAICFEN